jgi:hypothetical protein
MSPPHPDAHSLASLNRSALEAHWRRPFPIPTTSTCRAGPGVPALAEIAGAAGGWLPVVDERTDASAWLDVSLAGRPLPATVCVIGAACGAILEVLAERSSSVRVLVLEPEPGLVSWLLSRRDWRDLIGHGRLLVLWGPDYDGGALAWRLLDGESTPLVMVHPLIGRERRDAAKTAARVIGRAVNDWTSNRQAREALADIYLRNTLANLPVLGSAGDVAQATGRCAGRPAIVAGAGPSLNANLTVLTGVPHLRDRAVVIATDTAMRPCLDAGVVPHFALAVDATDANASHLLGLPEDLPTWLVAEASVAPAAVSAFLGRVLLWRVGDHPPWPLLHALGIDRGRLEVWGSVLTAAADFALRLGCDPIVFIGADLAYTDGQPYCRGTVFEAVWAADAAAGTPIPEQWRTRYIKGPPILEPGVEGRETQTASHFTAFRDWLVDLSLRRPDRRFVNATGAGILRGGAITQQAVEQVAATLSDGTAGGWSLGAPTPGADRLADRLLSRGAAAFAGLAPPLVEAARATVRDACDRLELSRLDAMPVSDTIRAAVRRAQRCLDHVEQGRLPLDDAVARLAAARDWDGWRPLDLIRFITRAAVLRIGRPATGGARTRDTLAGLFQQALTDALHPGIAASAYDQLHALSWHLRDTADPTRFVTGVAEPMRRHARRWIDAVGLTPGRRAIGCGLRIGYLGYNARLAGRHPTALAVLELLRGHHALRTPDVGVEYFAWGACDDEWRQALAAIGIPLHELDWPAHPCSALASLWGVIADTALTALVSDQPLGVPTVLFAARPTGCQVLLDTSVGPWLPGLIDYLVTTVETPATTLAGDRTLSVVGLDALATAQRLESLVRATSTSSIDTGVGPPT